MIDFDSIDDWAADLTDALKRHVPETVRQAIAGTSPKFIEDSKEQLFKLAPREAVIAATLDWIRSNTIAAYHGTRLTEVEIESVHATGLKPLRAEDRRDRLVRALSGHPDWLNIETGLDASIQRHGGGNAAGHREGQVHLTLSRAGLTEGFNHYLRLGSEFDQRVAYDLLGKEGMELLSSDGTPTLIQVAVPGRRALEGANPHFTVADMLRLGETPNLVNSFLNAWAYRLTCPSYQSRTCKLDCGIRFESHIPSEWLAAIKPH